MFRPRRRPLLRGAMIGGAGYMAGKNAANNRAREGEQEARISELEAQQAPAPAAASAGGVDVVAELTKLKGLLDAGVLTQDEFDVAKQKVLAS